MRALAAAVMCGVLAGRAASQSHDIVPLTDRSVIASAAARQPAPRWRLPLGTALVEEMRVIDGGRLLVGLRKDEQNLPGLEYLLIAEDSGRVIWRRPSPDKGDFAAAIVFDDAVLFQGRPGREDELVLVDLATGKDRWTIRAGGANVQLFPFDDVDRLLVVRRAGKKAEIVGYELTRGRESWRRPFPADSSTDVAIAFGDGVAHFGGDLRRLSAVSGDSLPTFPCRRNEDDAPPIVERGRLHVVCDSSLVAIDESGTVVWRTPLAEFAAATSLYLDGDHLVVRGMANHIGRERAGGEGAFLFARYDARNGRIHWMRRTPAPTLSNVVSVGGHLFVATPRSIVAFDTATGVVAFSTDVDQTGRVYPVRLRAYEDRVVFIGEVVIAAISATSGQLIYRHGLTPISQETSLTQLDALIPRLEAQVAQMTNRPQPGGPGLASAPMAEMQRYQQMANHWGRQEDLYRMRGDATMRDVSASRQRAADRQAQRMNELALYASLFEIGLRFYLAHRQRVQAAVWEGFLKRETLFRRAIISAHQLGMDGDYVLRAEQAPGAGGGAYTTLTVVHLPTGQRRSTIVSPSYESHGLWNRFDAEGRMVYHAGIGLDTTVYAWSEPRPVWPHKKARTIQPYLIAVPVRMP